MNLDLEGRVAVVTGASRGLGKAAALALAAEGARVLAVARSEESLESLATETDGAAVAHVADMTDLPSIPSIIDKALEVFDKVDIVVNNAGIAPATPLLQQDLEEWQRTIDINLTAPVELAKEAVRHMKTRGEGKIINIASTSGIRGKALLGGYSASKAGLIRLTEAAATEWSRYGIQVNAIAPGAFATDAQRAVLESESLLARRLAKIPAGRMGTVDEIGPLVCYLASPLADFISGAVFAIDGGEVSRL